MGCSVRDFDPGWEVKEEQGESGTFDSYLPNTNDTLYALGELNTDACSLRSWLAGQYFRCTHVKL